MRPGHRASLTPALLVACLTIVLVYVLTSPCLAQRVESRPVQAGIAGTVRGCRTGAPFAGVRMLLTGDEIQSTRSDASGFYAFEPLDPGDYTVTPEAGGPPPPFAIRAFDAALCARVSAGIVLPRGSYVSARSCEKRACDVTGDGLIDRRDVDAIARYAVGLGPAPGHIAEWMFNPPSRTYPMLSDFLENQDFSAVLMGDVDGSWETGGRSGPPVAAGRSVQVVATADDLKLIFRSDTKRDLISADILVKYNPRVLEFDACGLGPDMQEFESLANTETDGRFALCCYRVDPVPVHGEVAVVNFRILGTGNPRVVVEGFYLNDRLLHSGPVAATAVAAFLPKSRLVGSTPNPFNPETMIRFSQESSEPCHMTLEIYNLLGQHVRTLVDEVCPPGEYQIRWDGQDESGEPVPSGVYFCRLECGEQVGTQKLLLLK